MKTETSVYLHFLRMKLKYEYLAWAALHRNDHAEYESCMEEVRYYSELN